jgi:hypothetical protein
LSTGVFGATPATSQLMTINAAGALGSVATFETTYAANPIATNNMTLGTGTIAAMTVRGVSTLTPFPITMDVSTAGKEVTLRIPAFSITTTSGGPGTVVNFSGALPSIYWPTTNQVMQGVLMNSGGATISSAVNYITISSAGVITLTVQTTAWSTPFGFPNDQIVKYLAA